MRKVIGVNGVFWNVETLYCAQVRKYGVEVRYGGTRESVVCSPKDAELFVAEFWALKGIPY